MTKKHLYVSCSTQFLYYSITTISKCVGFQQAVDDFTKRIIERAKVKRKEMDEAENKKGAGGRSKDVPLGPGGLNPYEVMERSVAVSPFTNIPRWVFEFMSKCELILNSLETYLFVLRAITVYLTLFARPSSLKALKR